MAKSLGRDVFYGALAGTIGAACMTPLRLGARRFGLVDKMVPQAIEEALAARAGIDKATPKELHHAADQLLHLGFGATLGTVYALVTRRRRTSALKRGLVFGTAAYLLGAGVVVPALGAARPLWRARPAEFLVNLASHLLYGVTTALVADEMASQKGHRPTSDWRRHHQHVG
jgi:putative membrane protein